MADDTNFVTETACINWFDSSHQLHIRVYSSNGDTITERSNDGSGWTTGTFSQPGSHVSAMVWTVNGGAYVRVYCTVEGTTTEWCWDPGTGWYKGGYTQA